MIDGFQPATSSAAKYFSKLVPSEKGESKGTTLYLKDDDIPRIFRFLGVEDPALSVKDLQRYQQSKNAGPVVPDNKLLPYYYHVQEDYTWKDAFITPHSCQEFTRIVEVVELAKCSHQENAERQMFG